MGAGLMKKKRIAQKTQKQKNPRGGLKINTIGLSLMTNVQTCDEGMSPLMLRFQAKKKKQWIYMDIVTS